MDVEPKDAMPDLLRFCRPVAERSTLPMAAVEGTTPILRYVNPAFCLLLGRKSEELIGKSFVETVPEGQACLALLNRVYRTGKAETYTKPELGKSHTDSWSYVMWPVLGDDECPLGVMIQMNETTILQQRAAAMNQSLLLSGIRQHELTEAAEKQNTQLQLEIHDRKQAEEALRAELTALTSMHALSCKILESGQMQLLLQEILGAAVAIMGAKSGTLRLLEDDWLRIVAHHGHEKPFLDFFGSLENGASACTEAKRRGGRVIVPDVEKEPLFAGTPSLAMLRREGVRAVQSTPIISRTGTLLGMLTTHWEVAYTPTEQDLWRIDLLARQAADLIEHSRVQEEIRKARDELELRVRERTAELECRNRELQDFVFAASHDLSEPLRKIQTFGDLLKTKADHLKELERDYISRMSGAANRMQELLDALLRYSRVGTRGLEFRPAKLDDIVRDSITDLEVSIREAGAHVEINPLPTVMGDPLQFRQLFQNLIDNSLKYHRSEVKPVVRIYGEENSGTISIIVDDNGIGFDEKYSDKIFQPFQRLHGRKEYPGVGMGLAICRKIVERHGGMVTVKSTPGKGSTFIVTLPRKHGVNESGFNNMEG